MILRIVPHFLTLVLYYNCMDKNAGTITIIRTMDNMRNIGAKSFVPASSPSLLALAFLSSKACIVSTLNISPSPFIPFLKFWDKSAPSLAYS